ncbi:MAG: hypothetical protein ACR2N6_09310 [Miltoncostaeaceae bacterium]
MSEVPQHDSGRHGPDEDAGPTWVLVSAMIGLIVFLAAVTVVTVLLV